jgi:hypothetical protein
VNITDRCISHLRRRRYDRFKYCQGHFLRLPDLTSTFLTLLSPFPLSLGLWVG